MVIFQAPCGLSLGGAYLLARRLEEAHAFAEHTLALTRTHPERGHQAYALRLVGEIAARCNPSGVDQAEDCHRKALALADEFGMRPLVAHYHLGLGTLYLKTGRREQARSELAAAIELCRSMEMPFYLRQAEAAWRMCWGQDFQVHDRSPLLRSNASAQAASGGDSGGSGGWR